MKNTYRNLLKIIKSSLFDNLVVIEDDLDYKEILELSKKHQIIPLVSNGLYKYYGNIAEIEEFRTYTYKLICHDQNQLYYLDKIEKCFESNNVDYMLLKGAALKKYYQSSEFRLMGDIDILIKEEQYIKIRELLLKIGLAEVKETDHELIWHSGSGVIIELHKRLIPSYNDDYYIYYQDPWEKARQKNGHCFSMSDEDEYIYVFTHLTKHYRDGGIGLRHIIDICVLAQKNPSLDMQYIKGELTKLELDTFHQNILHTIKVWFDDEVTTELSDYITERIIESGSYGIKERCDLANAARISARTTSVSVAKKKTIFSLVFMPYTNMKVKYPLLKKMPILLPIMWIVRWVDSIIYKRNTIMRQLERVSKIDVRIVDNYNKELEMVGLKFELNKTKHNRGEVDDKT